MNPRPQQPRGRQEEPYRINHKIRVREVRVVGDFVEGGNAVLPVEKAIKLAQENELDLVEISPNVDPPVCKILDYAKFKYEQKKKQKEMTKKWLHMEFLEEIINDFVGWASPADEATGNTSVSGSAVTRRGSYYSSVASQPENYFDLTTEDGREEFLNLVMPVSLTKKRMEGAHFSCRFDGQFHPSMPVKLIDAYCQVHL